MKEDISSIRTRHSKNGGVIANYRIIDALNGELLYTDNLSSEAAFEDESIEGIEIGRFVQKAKVANLPADREILRDLAQALAEKYCTEDRIAIGKAGAPVPQNRQRTDGGRRFDIRGTGAGEGDCYPSGQGTAFGTADDGVEAVGASDSMIIQREMTPCELLAWVLQYRCCC